MLIDSLQTMNKYIECFDNAFRKYSQQSNRPGYTFGIFSKIRHSQKLYPHIDALYNDLQTADDASAKEILNKYFQSSKTTYNNHSFGLYLIDELSTKYFAENWEQFLPANKTIVFYQGILYRGSQQQPADAFENGMFAGKNSNNIEDYANDTNYSIGVSTSINEKIAESYQTIIVYRPGVAFAINGYLYKINYRGLGGIDINKTQNPRKKAFRSINKEEVNIIGGIPKEDIIGCWDSKHNFFPNPNYQPDRSEPKAQSQAEHLAILFKKT